MLVKHDIGRRKVYSTTVCGDSCGKGWLFLGEIMMFIEVINLK